MRTAFLLLFASISLLHAQRGMRNPGFVGGMQSAHGILYTNTVNLRYDFEHATLTVANLNTNDHNESFASVSISDTTTDFAMSTSGEKAVISYVKAPADSVAVLDTGTNGLSGNFTDGNANRITVNWTATDSVSFGVWVKPPTMASDATGIIFAGMDNAASTRAYFAWRRSGGNYDWRADADGSTSSIGSSLTPDAWYFLSIKYVKSGSGSCVFEVYNITGIQVGSTLTETSSSANQVDRVRIGNLSPITTAATFYWDDLMVDWTSANLMNP